MYEVCVHVEVLKPYSAHLVPSCAQETGGLWCAGVWMEEEVKTSQRYELFEGVGYDSR